MMKKLVCLLIVLAVVSLASAATVKFVAPDLAGAMPGAMVEISIIADFDVANLVVTIGSDGGSASGLGTLHPAFKTMPNPGILRNSGRILIERISGSQGVQYGDGPVPAGESLYTFDYVVPMEINSFPFIVAESITGPTPFPPPPVPYTCTVDGVGGAISLNSIEPLIIIPEPMTIALLGLGGLFIRRRK